MKHNAQVDMPKHTRKNIPKDISARHAKWVMEALASGPAKRLKTRDLDAAFQKGVGRARARQ